MNDIRKVASWGIDAMTRRQSRDQSHVIDVSEGKELGDCAKKMNDIRKVAVG